MKKDVFGLNGREPMVVRVRMRGGVEAVNVEKQTLF